MPVRKTYLIVQSVVQRALTMPEAVQAVEHAFRAYGQGQAQMPPKSYLYFDKGDLRTMPAYLPELGLAAVKNVSAHPSNRRLPAVMATITLFDPDTGFPLAVMDGTYLTAMRTGAAGGIAAKYLARPDCAVAGFIGAGRQAETQLAALLATMSGLRTVLAYDLKEARARRFTRQAARNYGLNASASSLEEAIGASDIVTTVTPARAPIVRKAFVRPGTHINAIGADAPGKQELEIALLKAARVVVDNWEQAAHGGEINVAVAQGLLARQDVYADMGQVVTGRKPGRQSPDEITVFDSTGLAIQDLACAAHVYRRLMRDRSMRVRLPTAEFLGGS